MYEAPSIEIFEEMKAIATEIWNGYSNEFGYRAEKLNYINSFGNIEDNAMVFYRMFDYQNQAIFRSKASADVLAYIEKNS
jgi:hypothetical protein